MKNKSIMICTIIIAAFFVLAILFFSFALIREYRGGPKRTGAVFDHMVTGTKKAASTHQSNSLEFRVAFEQNVSSIDNYNSIVLSKNNSPIFIYPVGAKEANPSGKFYKTYSNTFTVSGDIYKINATMYLLRPSSLFYYARAAFLIVMFGSVLLVALILYIYLKKNVAEDNGVNEDAYNSFSANINEREPDMHIFDMEADDDKDKKQETDVSPNQEEIFNDSLAEKESEQYFDMETDLKKDYDDEIISIQNGIFSPATGFCWEQHLEPRLDTELIRATASETDLSLLLIRIPGLVFSEPLTKVICTYLQQQFQYSDLLFEYMPDGFAIIKEDMSINESLSLAETVLAEINNIIYEKGYNCYIGISTRSERILPGKRILLEAAEALKHAIEEGETSPIFAFKANDSKYREYIETHSGQI